MAKTVTIALDESLSGAVEFEGSGRLIAVIMPTAWTAANLTFQGSMDNSTFQDLYDDGGTEVTVTAAASRTISFREDMRQVFRAFRWIKVRSGTSGLAVTQAAARVLTLLSG